MAAKITVAEICHIDILIDMVKWPIYISRLKWPIFTLGTKIDREKRCVENFDKEIFRR